MSEEECVLAEEALRKRGYRYFTRFAKAKDRYSLRARKLDPRTLPGLREKPIDLQVLEDLARYL